MPHSDHLTQAKRVVIKIGSSLLVDNKSGTLNEHRIAQLGEEITRLRQRGQHVLLVSSGAIALGRHYLELTDKQQGLDYSQAAAASGQVILAHGYYQLMANLGLKAAQILLTVDDTENRRRYLNARNTLDRLLEIGAVPVINENDSVATDEIRYGDNDRLAARVAQMMSAECLVLLSDIDGLYSRDPNQGEAEHIATVTHIDKHIESLAGITSTDYGTGGMITKIAAAKICVPAGCATVIAGGHSPWPLRCIEEGGRCTWFLPQTTPQAARKRWIGGSLTPKGKIVIDDGAAAALDGGRSLLPVGVTQVQGEFDRGDAVVVCTADGREVGRGLVAYTKQESDQIKGLNSRAVAQKLGYKGQKAFIHRDKLGFGELSHEAHCLPNAAAGGTCSKSSFSVGEGFVRRKKSSLSKCRQRVVRPRRRNTRRERKGLSISARKRSVGCHAGSFNTDQISHQRH